MRNPQKSKWSRFLSLIGFLLACRSLQLWLRPGLEQIIRFFLPPTCSLLIYNHRVLILVQFLVQFPKKFCHNLSILFAIWIFPGLLFSAISQSAVSNNLNHNSAAAAEKTFLIKLICFASFLKFPEISENISVLSTFEKVVSLHRIF